MYFESKSPDNILVGAGQLFIARIASGTKEKLRHAGNVSTLELTTEDTKIQKYSSMTAARPLYKESLQRRIVRARAVFDEFSTENLALALQGAIDLSDSQAATPVVDEILEANVPAATLGAARGGVWYQLAKLGPIASVTVKLNAAVLVQDVDYELDHNNAMIGILTASVATTNGTDDLTISYTPTAYSQIVRIRGGSDSRVEAGAVYAPDPSDGPRHKIEWWRGAVTPDGPIGFISEDFGSMTLNFALQDDSAGQYGGSRTYPTHRVTKLASAVEFDS